MRRATVVALYATAGPALGGLVTAVGIAATGDRGTTPLQELMLICVALGFPFGVLAALGAGIAHAVLAGRLGAGPLIVAVVAAGLLAHTAMAYMIGNLGRVFESGWSAAGFAAPVIVSASVICGGLLLRQGRSR